MADPFTLRIFVPDGDPEGVRIIDRMNWTGLGIVFPREKWMETRQRPEFLRTGVYILVGFADDELPILYIGQADGLRDRIDSHFKNKEFWDRGCVFVSANNGLNRAHITWLEFALIGLALKAGRSHLDNSVTPTEPAMSESEKADTRGFLKEILRILPVVGLRAFEEPVPVAKPGTPETEKEKIAGLATDKDTVIVPAQKEGFDSVFLGENCWHAIRISGGMRPRLKWIAVYQTQPVSAVTHVAEIDRIEPYGEAGKYKVVFKGPAQKLPNPIPFADAPPSTIMGPRYTTYARLLSAKKLSELLG